MPTQKRRAEQGFTLIEVMIVVVIVGILLAVALPSYQEALQKGRRADGKAFLTEAANRQEQYMLDRSTYTTTLSELGLGTQSDEGHYTVTASACASGDLTRCYVLTATPTGTSPQDGDEDCFTFSLDSSGSKRALKKDGTAATALCW
ncbi:hypothetical protein BST95_06395 [Halioglobus japonicus]|uniref:Prepilin-type N-terminal cleavage/methylation domain-containing protein n=2 Tax=Halioglobus japonicus TaxID=930805 RepID=A0AAP8MDW3_9GAMM|nr:hypothetical protein BST95_06395 [Halioglobus japonicus]PLW85985.1 prepilin-type N-terminal cleavage/methylation domain-containing protein [Halioglobus japonicus]